MCRGKKKQKNPNIPIVSFISLFCRHYEHQERQARIFTASAKQLLQ